MEAAFKTESDNYADIVKKILGKKAGIIIDITFILITFSVATLYFIVGSKFMKTILTDFGVSADFAGAESTR